MNFLSPWFLLGALAIAGPILFHLIRRAARERTPFSSVMFLRPTPPRVTRRRRIEHWLLLLLRCLALLLLATGFARPFFVRESTLPEAAGTLRQVVLLIDTSASMRRDDLWSEAREALDRQLQSASPADEVAVIAFDQRPRTVVTFADWSTWKLDERAALAKERLAAVSPGWMGTQLGLALVTAAELFEDSSPDKAAARRELIVITDLQEGSRLDGLQGHDWPARVKVTIQPVAVPRRANAGIEVLNQTAARPGSETNVQVRVTNARNSGRERFQIEWLGVDRARTGTGPMDIYLPPGQSRTFAMTRDPSLATGQLRLTGDQEEFDNRSWFSAADVERLNVICLGAGAREDPNRSAFYLQHVFPNSPRREVNLIQHDSGSPLPTTLLNDAAFAFVSEPLNAPQATALRNWMESGRTALLILSRAEMASTLGALSGMSDVRLTEAGGTYRLLGEIDFSHPLFAPFADPRFSDFTRIHFWKHRQWDLPADFRGQVLARFDDRSPAFVQVPVGKGNLLVLTSGWTPADSQLAVSSKFPPLMQLLLDWSGASAPLRFQFQTGEPIPSPFRPTSRDADAAGAMVEWRRPDGSRQTLAPGAPLTATDDPGHYTAGFGGVERRFAVNLPLDESRTAPLMIDELARLGVPLQNAEVPIAVAQARQQQLRLSELENRQKLWRWLIVGVLAVTFVEIALAGWFTRRIRTVEAAA